MTMPRPDRVRVGGPLLSFAAGFGMRLVEQGYTPCSVQCQLQLLAHLSRWMEAGGVEVGELSPAMVEWFLAERRQRGYASRISLKGMRPLLGYLDGLEVLPAAGDLAPTPVDRLVEEFCSYLREVGQRVQRRRPHALHQLPRRHRARMGSRIRAPLWTPVHDRRVRTGGRRSANTTAGDLARRLPVRRVDGGRRCRDLLGRHAATPDLLDDPASSNDHDARVVAGRFGARRRRRRQPGATLGHERHATSRADTHHGAASEARSRSDLLRRLHGRRSTDRCERRRQRCR